jgi:hypothetical protein
LIALETRHCGLDCGKAKSSLGCFGETGKLTRKNLLQWAFIAMAALFGSTLRARTQSTVRSDAGRAFEKQVFKHMFGSNGENVAEFDFSGFPFSVLRTDGAAALDEHDKLKKAGQGFAVILGNDDDVDHIVESWDDGRPPDAAEILKRQQLSAQILTSGLCARGNMPISLRP